MQITGPIHVTHIGARDTTRGLEVLKQEGNSTSVKVPKEAVITLDRKQGLSIHLEGTDYHLGPNILRSVTDEQGKLVSF